MTTQTGSSTIRTTPLALAGLVFSYPVVALHTFSLWATKRRSRRALSHLSDIHLRDIGLDPMTRDHEAARPFWK
ncbi:MAG: DUF1127 domain-containing protein [Rhodobacteraceae bacterium]|nr:DUF1127 domain-containing protein [Paracoccaceae bacterium]